MAGLWLFHKTGILVKVLEVICLALKRILKSNSFLLVIFAVLVFTIMYPSIGLKAKEIGILDPMTFIAMFGSSLGLSFKKLTDSIKDYKSILYTFLSVYIIFPVVAWLLMLVTGLKGSEVGAGFMIIATQSSTVSSGVVLTMAALGNVPLALIITIVNNIASAFITPALLRFIMATEQQITFNVGEMIMNLVVVLVLPVVLAQIVRLFAEKWLKYINPVRKFVGQLVIVMFVLTGGASAADQLKSNIQVVFIVLLLVVVIQLIMLTLAALYAKISRVDKGTQVAVMLNGSQKTLPASVLVWGKYFPQYGLAPIVFVAYHMTQLVIGSIIGSKYKKIIEESQK